MTLTRRDLLKLTAGMTAGLAAGLRPKFVSAREQELNTTRIPSTGERVPVIGLGGRNYRTEWAEGGDLSEYRRTVETFVEGGGKIIDTSPNYCDSEAVLGGILDELGVRDRVFLATKVDREGRREGIERMEGSLERLRTYYVDLMQVHNLRGADVQLPTMGQWKEAGRIRYVGVTTSSERQYDRMAEIMERHDLDFVQVDYSLANRSAEERILPMARDRGLAVLVNLPFGRGRLFEAVGDRSLPGWASEIEADTWAKVFLKYVASYPGSVIPIPGMTQARHAADNVGALRGPMPDASLRRRMEAFFDSL